MKRALMTASALAMVLMSNSAYADDEKVLEQLKIMQEQINKLQGQVSNLKSELADAKSQAASAQKVAGEAKAKAGKKEDAKGSDTKLTLGPGPKIETADGEYSFKLGGFAQIDAGHFEDDKRDLPDGTRFRRARLSASGNITKDFNYKIEGDFANNATALTDVFLEYTGMNPFKVQIGQFKEPFGLETVTSDLFTNFVERASPFAFSPDRNIGLMLSTRDTESVVGAWTASIGGFGAGSGTNTVNDEAKDLTGRFTLAPIAEKQRVLHFGVAGSYRVPDSTTDIMRFSSAPETALVNNPSGTSTNLMVDTGNITAVDHVTLLGLEAAAVYGPASIQAEYVKAEVSRNAGLEPTFGGYYVEGSYFLTGESRNYNAETAKFDRTKPKWPFNIREGNWGAWQVMARYSDLDLNDASAGFTGGEMKNTTLGLKWYPNANTAVLLNYIMVNTDSEGVIADDDPRVWVLRTQFDF